jgi:hypothetical protein
VKTEFQVGSSENVKRLISDKSTALARIFSEVREDHGKIPPVTPF